MQGSALVKAALSSLMVATTMVGCTGIAFRPSSAAAPEKANPARLAAVAEKAIAGRDGARAVESAEAAVQLAPQNPAYRQLLGRAYVAAGRFASAQTALGDAITLGDTDARTIISLALVHAAQGRDDEARNLLVAHADTVPAADYGLAMALAGDPVEGVRILSQAIHDPSATARTRQNLAYAYALAGRWKDARMVVGMDMDTLAANKRISDWAQIAAPSQGPQRVAALMGVTVSDMDAGQPVALALAPVAGTDAMQMAATQQPDAPVEMAAMQDPVPPPPIFEPAPYREPADRTASVARPARPVAVAQAARPVPSRTLTVKIATVQAPLVRKPARVVAPLRVASGNFIVEHSPARGSARGAAAINGKPTVKAASQAVLADAAPSARLEKAAFLKPVSAGASNWVVQLGAFSNAAVTREKWGAIATRSKGLAAFPVLTSQATVKGRSYHRLAISGFASRTDAVAACRVIQSRHGQCFVRQSAPDATLQRWAVATGGRQFAAR